MVDIGKYRKETSIYLKWDQTENGSKPFYVQITDEPEEQSFRGKTKYNLPVLHGEDQQVLSCSQSALNALIDAAQENGVLDAVDSVLWKAWKTGEGYETRYHWHVADPSDKIPF